MEKAEKNKRIGKINTVHLSGRHWLGGSSFICVEKKRNNIIRKNRIRRYPRNFCTKHNSFRCADFSFYYLSCGIEKRFFCSDVL